MMVSYYSHKNMKLKKFICLNVILNNIQCFKLFWEGGTIVRYGWGHKHTHTLPIRPLSPHGGLSLYIKNMLSPPIKPLVPHIRNFLAYFTRIYLLIANTFL